MNDGQSQKILQQRADNYALSEDIKKNTSQDLLLTFYINKIKYAIEYKYLKKVILEINITPIPLSQMEFQGVCYYDGNVISVINASALFYGKLDLSESSLILIELKEKLIGLTVGEIIGQEFFDASIELVHFATEHAQNQKIISGIYKKEFSLINVDKLFDLFNQPYYSYSR